MEYIDERNLSVINEAYVGYGRDVLDKMTVSELNDELKRIEKELSDTDLELTDSDEVPSYVIKEKILNIKHYKEKVLKELEKRNNDVKEEGIDGMIKNLNRQYEKGYITKEYRDKYVEKLESRREAYNKALEDEKKKQKEDDEKKNKKKSHIFKKFKNHLSDYKKRIKV